MTIEAIKEAITELPDDDRSGLAAWLNGLGDDEWDKQMTADFSPNGRGMKLVEQVNRQIHEGRTFSFEEGRRQSAARQNSRPR